MKKLLCGIALGLATVVPAHAESTSQTETTVVTASRTEQTLNSSLAPVTVFTRDDIEQLQAKTFTELLSRIPGAAYSSSGGPGSNRSLYIRGSNTKHTLFLIDGQRFGSATLGETSFQFVDPEIIDRVEVVRGPRSSQYGSDAIGGVVQIFTKKGNEQPSHYIRTGAGSHDTWQIAGGSRGKLGALHYSANLSHLESDGFDNTTDKGIPSDDDDGHRNTSASLNLGYTSAQAGKIDVNYFHTRSKTDYDSDSSYGPEKPYVTNWIRTTNFIYQSPAFGAWTTQVMTGRSIDDSDNFDDLDSSSHYDYRTTRDSFSWQNDFNFAPGQEFIVGYDYYKDKIDSSQIYKNTEGKIVDSRDRKAPFAVYLANIGNWDIQLGLREDDDEDFGTETTTNAAVGYALNEQHKMIISYGEGFKAPTFNDLYYDAPWGVGNPNLKSETSENYELELRGNYDTFIWNLNLYRTTINDLIDWSDTFPTTPVNVKDAEIKGAELSIHTQVLDWALSAAISYLEARNAENDKHLENRPNENLSLDADRDFGNWEIGWTLEVSGSRYSDAANTDERELAGYGILNARLGYQVSEKLKAQIKLNNLFDKNYYTNRTSNFLYNTDGFNAFMTLTYTF